MRYNSLVRFGLRVSGFELSKKTLDSNPGTRHRLVSQIFDLFFIHAEVVGDFVQNRQANFFVEILGIGKIFEQRCSEYGNLIRQERRIETGSVRQRHALIDAVKRFVARIESFGAQKVV